MSALVIDASVWVAAADPTDPASAASRRFPEAVVTRAVSLAMPTLARIKVACGRARLLRNAPAARRIADGLVGSPLVTEHALESGGEGAVAALVAQLGARAEIARELAYRLYTLCERKKRAAEALAYHALVQSRPEIARLARQGGKPKTEQAVLFDGGDA